jgi:adenosine deaminase
MAQTELHRHLDVSVRTSTLLALAQERGLEGESTSLESFKDKLILKEPMSDLTSVLATFQLFQQVLDRPDVLERVAYEVVEDCQREGLSGVELRFSPSFVCELSKLAWQDAIDGFHAGVERALRDFPKMKAGLILIASRDYGPDAALKTMDLFLKNRDRLIGVDLAGPEDEFPCRLFEKAFRRARDEGARITIHAGESTGPENIWEAIELLGAERIGHGIACVKDPELMRTLAEREICLEMCPTSNWLTRAAPDLSKHPLPQVLRAGIPVSINTDDPAVFGCTMPGEIEICRKRMGLNQDEIAQTFACSQKHSFLA